MRQSLLSGIRRDGGQLGFPRVRSVKGEKEKGLVVGRFIPCGPSISPVRRPHTTLILQLWAPSTSIKLSFLVDYERPQAHALEPFHVGRA